MVDLPPGTAAADLPEGKAAARERIRQLEERLAALAAAAAEREAQAAAEITAYQTAYAERVGYLERQVAALTEAAIAREAGAAADREAYKAAYIERVDYAHRIRDLKAEVAALSEAAGRREQEIDAHNTAHAEAMKQLQAELISYREAYKSRVGELEAQVTALTEAAIERENRTATEIAALTEAAVERERKFQQRGQTDYQLLMIYQGMLAEFKDLEPDFQGIYERCKPFTMTSVERLYALYETVEYLCASKIEGDLAECGVWQGGSCMLMAFTLLRHRSTIRGIWMFDTFAGHPQPDAERDIDLWGNRALDEWRRHRAEEAGEAWGGAPLADVQANLASTGYPENRLHFIEGMVENTVPSNIPGALALLHLDTDWYESTRIALLHLYPRLVSGGVLIIDDYGHYKGQRQAVDEYFNGRGQRPLLHRIDYSCRVMVKP